MMVGGVISGEQTIENSDNKRGNNDKKNTNIEVLDE